MEINLKNIELFKNMSQIEFEGHYYDFHNDYDFVKVLFEGNLLAISFKHIVSGLTVSLEFHNVDVVRLEADNKSSPKTLENLYRGRFEVNGKLYELSDNDKLYFYLEFYEGQKMEFFSKHLIVKQDDSVFV